MATAAASMIGSAVIGGLGFSGGSWLFSKIDPKNYSKEVKRHNLAIEKLTKERDDWNKRRLKNIDFINSELKKENISITDFRDVDQAMKMYTIVTKNTLPPLPPEPKLKDFYEPSEEMKKYEYAWIILGTLGLGVILYKFF